MKLKHIDMYLDGGSFLLTTNEGTFIIDHSLNTKNDGEITCDGKIVDDETKNNIITMLCLIACITKINESN